MSHSGVVAGLYAGTFAVEISTNNLTWTAVSNATVKIDDIELSRPSGEAYVGGASDYATVTIGKREPVEITLTFLYNEDTNSVTNTIYDQFRSSSPRLGVRWSPRGLVGRARAYATSDDGSTFGLGVITNVTLSALDPSDAAPYVAMVTVRTSAIRQYTIAENNPTNLNPSA